MFVSVELVLRAAGYGSDRELIIADPSGGPGMYRVNRDGAGLYFRSGGLPAPALPESRFSMPDPDTVARIFCLGESTMAGFPFEFQAAPAGMLQYSLRHRFPGRSIDVIDLGIAGSSSYITLDVLRTVIPYRPSLVVVYAGHNEFYGVLGARSTMRMPGGHGMTRFLLRLMKFRTFQLVQDAVVSVRSALRATEQSDPARTLMERLAISDPVVLGSDDYVEVLDQFRKNLRTMVEIADAAGVPIVFIAPVSNTHTQAPFADAYGPPPGERVAGVVEWALRDFGPVDEEFASGTSDLHAGQVFRLARRTQARGFADSAVTLFEHARDLDGLRFRASGDFILAVRESAPTDASSVVPLDSVFRSRTIADTSALFLEHVHPTSEGYRLLTKELLRLLTSRRLVVPPDDWDRAGEWPDLSSRVTAFDEAVARIRVSVLTRRWPFDSSPGAQDLSPSTPEEEAALAYLRGDMTWSGARLTLAETYAAGGRLLAAQSECLIVAEQTPGNSTALLRAADYALLDGRFEPARVLYVRCVDVDDNPYARIKLALLDLQSDAAATAEAHLQHVRTSSRNPFHQLPVAARAYTHYLRAVASAHQGRDDHARAFVDSALQVDPSHMEAQAFRQFLAPRR